MANETKAVISKENAEYLDMFAAFIESLIETATVKQCVPTLYQSPIGTRFRSIKGAEDLRCENAHWVKVGNEIDGFSGKETGNCICVLVLDGRFVLDDEILDGGTIPVVMP